LAPAPSVAAIDDAGAVPAPEKAAAAVPVRIPFKMAAAAPSLEEEAKPKAEPWLTKASLAAASETPEETTSAAVVAEPARVAEVKIALPLLPILKNLPPMQLTGDPSCVPPDVRLELPFALIEPQLASGRVSVTAKVFEVSMPVSFRGLFQAGPGEVDVSLPLQEVLKNTDEKLDAKGVVALINKIPGVKACAVLFGDGLALAGGLPAELETDGLCAMAPSLLQRVENHLVDTKLGPLRGMTLSCVKGAITFYMHENLCLAAQHADVDLPSETRDRLSRIVHELSRKYSHPV
jgi:predicted regulator of Ras-like GTPase activity (Roadblock/LC7/MglB family)